MTNPSTLAGTDKLAIDGGPKALQEPWPARHLFGEEEKQAVIALMDQCIDTGEAFLYHGEQEEAYCREFADYMGGGFADGVNSGSSAIWVALRAMQIEPFSEVIVPPVSDSGGFMPVALNNCIPVPADSYPGAHNAGPEQIEERLTDLTSAIIVAHIFGTPVDLDPIMEMARARGIVVIEDCAQAHGATYKGRLVGTIGDIAAFSTMGGKHHATGGQGGVVFVKDEETYWRVRRAADRSKPLGVPDPPWGMVAAARAEHNLNLNELSAAIGRVQLRKLPEITAGRRRFAGLVADACERELQAVRVERELPETESVYWHIFFELDAVKLNVDKNRFVDALHAEGFPAQRSFLLPVTSSAWFRERKVFGDSGYPWRSPLYRGDPDREYALPNLEAADARRFWMHMHERCGEQEAADLIAALKKLESVYLK
jgi:dTDP-4-amino-4,6-dideoxygalactose transaminase